MNTYQITDLKIAFHAPSEYIHSYFEAFSCPMKQEEAPDMSWLLEEDTDFDITSYTPIIDTNLLKIYILEHQDIMLYYPEETNVTRSILRKNATEATVYFKRKPKQEELEAFSWSLYLAFRDVFFCLMQKRDLIAVHSSSIIYNGKGYLFSASSGVGKSTHTNMWVDLYQAEILDGDVAACKMVDGKVVVYGLPWCGTSKLFQNKKLELGGIIFLAQGCHNAIHPLNDFEAILRLSARCFTPTWTEALADKNLQIAENIATNVPCAVLSCLPNTEAVEICKKFIDGL